MLADSLARCASAVERLAVALEHPEEHLPHILLMLPTAAAPPWWVVKIGGHYPNRTAALIACRRAEADTGFVAQHRTGMYRYAIRPAP
jgi:hypothetical protein